MSRIEEIEAAIDNLPSAEYLQIVAWFRAREQRRWDRQLDSDSQAGKLDLLFDEADRELASGHVRTWPPSE